MSRLDHLRPNDLHHNPAYSHVVTASGARTIYISGQVSVDEEGRIVGEGDLAAQTTALAGIVRRRLYGRRRCEGFSSPDRAGIVAGHRNAGTVGQRGHAFLAWRSVAWPRFRRQPPKPQPGSNEARTSLSPVILLDSCL